MKNKRFDYIYPILMVIFIIICAVLLILEWTINIFKDVRFLTEEIIGVTLSLFQTILIAWFISGELRKNSKITKQSLDLESQGISGVNKNGELLQSELKDLFTNAKLIKIMVVCGKTFITKNLDLIKHALINKCEIRLLIAKEDSLFIQQITEQLDALDSKENGKINDQKKEILDVLKLVKYLQKYGNINVRQFETEYRVPFYLGYFPSKDQMIIKGWYNSIVPVCSPREVLMFKGELKEEDRTKYVNIKQNAYLNKKGILETYNFETTRKNGQRNTIVDLETHFDYLWRKYEISNS